MNRTADAMPSLEELRWQCRRGMLELDLLFESFLVHQYAQLPPRLKRQFTRLLGYPDPLILAWIMEDEALDDPSLEELLVLLRSSGVQE